MSKNRSQCPLKADLVAAYSHDEDSYDKPGPRERDTGPLAISRYGCSLRNTESMAAHHAATTTAINVGMMENGAILGASVLKTEMLVWYVKILAYNRERSEKL